MASYEARNPVSLDLTASTARILNLHKVFEKYGNKEFYLSDPFFQNKILNRSIIVKHKLRPSEIADFKELNPISTKLIIPIDVTNLKMGVYYLFVGQRNFSRILSEKLNKKEKIKKVIQPMVEYERENDILYDNEDYVSALQEKYPRSVIEMHQYIEVLNF